VRDCINVPMLLFLDRQVVRVDRNRGPEELLIGVRLLMKINLKKAKTMRINKQAKKFKSMENGGLLDLFNSLREIRRGCLETEHFQSPLVLGEKAFWLFFCFV